MPRAKKYRIRRTLTLTREANSMLNDHAKMTQQELSQIASEAIVRHVRHARAEKFAYDQAVIEEREESETHR